MGSASTIARYLFAAGMLLACAASGAQPVRQYDYRVIYQGPFSLGAEMPIADLALQTHRPADGGELREARLEVSSEAYPVVESLYPIRYRFRSWTGAADGQLVGFESLERTRKERHRLYLRDGSERGVRRLDARAAAGQDAIARLDAGVRPAVAGRARQLFDRLGLLQLIRGKALHERDEYRLPVTNGRDLMVYRVKVEGSEMLPLDGRWLPAWKVRFDGYEVAADGREEAVHRPVFIWLSRDPEQVPLRVDARHAVGLFRIELKTPARQLALSDS